MCTCINISTKYTTLYLCYINGNVGNKKTICINSIFVTTPLFYDFMKKSFFYEHFQVLHHFLVIHNKKFKPQDAVRDESTHQKQKKMARIVVI